MTAAGLLSSGDRLEKALLKFDKMDGLEVMHAIALLILENTDLRESLEIRDQLKALWPETGVPA